MKATAAQRSAQRISKRMETLRRDYEAACKEAFPPGTEVCYAHGETLRYGVVEDAGYGSRVQILGATGTRYWIDTYRLLDELE